ncbi:hypothetical protein PG996_007804 [Apiospora saccharicola]|uniref:Uncharacterized protein n=1 Tax=Apiospora saccharicola TaxID=335842 RepID=A0ABR1UW57_9PEZI
MAPSKTTKIKNKTKGKRKAVNSPTTATITQVNNSGKISKHQKRQQQDDDDDDDDDDEKNHQDRQHQDQLPQDRRSGTNPGPSSGSSDHLSKKSSGSPESFSNSSADSSAHPANSSAGNSRKHPPTSGKNLSTSAINIKRREDYANMDAASKDRERTRVKRSRAVKMARDSLPHTAWAELGRREQAEVAEAISEEIRSKYAATTPGPSSRTAAEYAVRKVFADKLHLFLPDDGRAKNNERSMNNGCAMNDGRAINEQKNAIERCANGEDSDTMDVDEDENDSGTEKNNGDSDDVSTEDDWNPFELTSGWKKIVED